VELRVTLAKHRDKPVEDVTHRGLSGFNAEIAGEHRAIHDAAHAGNVRRELGLPGHRDVAGGRTQDLHQRPGSHPRTHRAVMGIEGAHRHRDSRGKPQPAGPLLAQTSRRDVRGMCLLVQPRPQFAHLWVEKRQELGVGQTAPVLAVHRFVARRTHAALDVPGPRVPHQQGRDVVAELDPACRRFEYLGGDVQAMPDLRPEPFRGICPAGLVQVLRAMLLRERRDLLCLGHGGVVFPQPGQGIGVALEPRVESQRYAFLIHRDGCRAGSIHPDADDLLGREIGHTLCLMQYCRDAPHQPVVVVRRVLPGNVRVAAVADDPCVAPRVVVDRGGDLLPRPHINDQRPHRIGSVIQPQ